MVPSGQRWGDPSRHLGVLAKRLKAPMPAVGLMTAVPMSQVVVVRDQQDRISLECFCTVGVTNAVSAGEPVGQTGGQPASDRVGTINIVLITSATLSGAAMVGAVQVATESKTAVLRDNRVPSAGCNRLATGTGTDAVVVASGRSGTVKLTYSGTHTILGSMIGRLVTQAVQEGLNRSIRWHQSAGGRRPAGLLSGKRPHRRSSRS